MSTIMRALRRLEEEKEELAVQDRLHGEVVAPLPAAIEQPARPLWHWVALAACVSLLVGGGAYGVRAWLDAGDAGAPTATQGVVLAPTSAPPVLGQRVGRTPGQPADRRADTGRAPAPQRPDIGHAAPAGAPTATAAAPLAVVPAPEAAAVHAAAQPAPATIPTTAPTTARTTTPTTTPTTTTTTTTTTTAMPTTLAETASAAASTTPPATTPAAGTPQPGARADGRPIGTLPIRDPAEVAVELATPEPIEVARAEPPPKPAAEPKPTSWRTSKPAPERARTTRYGRREELEVVVLRTVWHPEPDRRVAHVSTRGDDAVVIVKEGETFGALTVDEIRLSEVVFEGDAGRVKRRVGEGR